MEERKPMLGDEKVKEVADYRDNEDNPRQTTSSAEMAALDIRNIYEDLITKGVLRVVKKTRVVFGSGSGKHLAKCCELCDYGGVMNGSFCPGCGAEIVK